MNGSSPDISRTIESPPDVWQFSDDMTGRLFTWNVFNVLAGLIFGRRVGFLRGFASQNVGWGLINIALAMIASRQYALRRESVEDPAEPEIQAAETRKLRLLLAGNGLLDVVYMLIGRRIARGRGSLLAARRGIGVGIVVQGALLFFFDWWMFRRSFRIRSS